MTTKQLTKLENRIATLKSQKRIVWIEGIQKDIIKGKIAGKACYFVRAESLNENGGSWYYIVRFVAVAWLCTCDDKAHRACIHAASVNALMVAQYQAKREQEAAQKLLDSILHEDMPVHVEDDLRMASRIVNGKIEPCRWNELSESEKREAYTNMFEIY